MNRDRSSWSAVAHPATLAAIAVLALNDRVLKDRWPGLVTGKLSDVAGLFCFPILLAALLGLAHLRRPGTVAFAATATAFTLIKTWEPARLAADLALDRLVGPSTIRRDWTDLVALGAMVPAWRRWNRERAEPSGWWRRAAHAGVLVVGLSVCAATSCDFYDWSVERVEVYGATLVAFSESGYASQLSIDGGRTWHPTAGNGQVPRGTRQFMKRLLCLQGEPEHCFRLRRGMSVEERIGTSDWVEVFRLPAEAGAGQFTLTARGCFDTHDLDRTFLGMVEAPDGGAGTVVVAMGTEGVLVREPASDAGTPATWRQVAVDDVIPAQDVDQDDDGGLWSGWFSRWTLFVPVGLSLIAGAITLGVVRRGNRRRRAAEQGPWWPPPPG